MLTPFSCFFGVRVGGALPCSLANWMTNHKMFTHMQIWGIDAEVASTEYFPSLTDFLTMMERSEF